MIGGLPFKQEHVHHKDVVVYFLPVVVDVPLYLRTDPGMSQHNDVVHLRYKSTTRWIATRKRLIFSSQAVLTDFTFNFHCRRDEFKHFLAIRR